jgi:hypothetical protein
MGAARRGFTATGIAPAFHRTSLLTPALRHGDQLPCKFVEAGGEMPKKTFNHLLTMMPATIQIDRIVASISFVYPLSFPLLLPIALGGL